jgi:hypothetical protein
MIRTDFTPTDGGILFKADSKRISADLPILPGGIAWGASPLGERPDLFLRLS